jgi:hypothetical protein
MKIYRALGLGAAIALSQFALAELPIPNGELGQKEGMLDFCSEANPKSAAKYKERGKALVGNASEKDLADARDSGEYKDSYDLIGDELRKVSKDDAVKACTDFAEEK